MDTRIPVIVRMRVECASCGHAERVLGFRARHVTAFLFVTWALVGCTQSTPAYEANADTIKHDSDAAPILPCGSGVFEYEGVNSSSRCDLSVRDGAQIIVSVAHRVGWSRMSHLLGLGDDGTWLEGQFQAGAYDLKHGADSNVTAASYLLGQYARHYCTERPFDTLRDAIDNLVSQAQAKK